VVLYPLTEVCIGVFVPIVVGSRQLVMDVLRHGKRRKGQQQQDKSESHSASKKAEQLSYGRVQSHSKRANHRCSVLVKQQTYGTLSSISARQGPPQVDISFNIRYILRGQAQISRHATLYKKIPV